MINFMKMGDVNPLPLLHAIKMQPDLWDRQTLRTKHPGSAHAQVSDIWLRFNDVAEYERTGDPASIANDRDCIECPAWRDLPQVRPIVFDLMRMVEGVQLGRVIITRMKPGSRITPHVDQGSPATFYSRYQVALQSLPGANFNIGDETMNFRSGEVWWIDNEVEHSVENNSADDRIVMIVDIRTADQC